MSEKIVILISAPIGGGAEKSMRMIHLRLRQMRQNSLLISINKVNLTTAGEGEINLGRTQRSGLVATIWSFVKFNFYLARFKPTAIILNCEIAELLGVFCLRPNVNFFVLEHANPSWEGRRILGIFVRRLLAHRGAKFVAVSSHIAPPFSLHDYTRVIPNPIESTLEIDGHESSNEIRRLVYIGRLTKVHKNPELIVALSKATNIPAVFLGTGEMMDHLKGQAQQLGVYAEFPGWVEDPWARINEYDLVVVPSDHEGDGLVVVEAILRQVPILLSDIPDFRRFELSDSSYCSSLEDFTTRVNEYRYKLSRLSPSLATKQSLEDSRSLDRVVNLWLEVLASSNQRASDNHTK